MADPASTEVPHRDADQRSSVAAPAIGAEPVPAVGTEPTPTVGTEPALAVDADPEPVPAVGTEPVPAVDAEPAPAALQIDVCTPLSSFLASFLRASGLR
jgi:hypothetical protein